MPAELHALLSRDHERLDGLLASCLRENGTVIEETYDAFRRGLLRHIAIEERVLFPRMRKLRGDTALEHQLHRDHAALAALLVPPPSASIVECIRTILSAHNPLEENAGGLYELMEEVAGSELSALIDAVRKVPPVPVAPHTDTPLVRRTIEELLRLRVES
jgi:hypothetical protein